MSIDFKVQCEYDSSDFLRVHSQTNPDFGINLVLVSIDNTERGVLEYVALTDQSIDALYEALGRYIRDRDLSDPPSLDREKALEWIEKIR